MEEVLGDLGPEKEGMGAESPEADEDEEEEEGSNNFLIEDVAQYGDQEE